MNVSELNKRKVREFFEEVLNEGRLELIDELVAKDFIGRLGGVAAALSGRDGVRRFVTEQHIACPNLYIKIEDQIAEGDRVATRWRVTVRAPHPLVETASIGPSPTCAGITIVRLLAGKQVDAHTECAGLHLSG
jgi:predicted SnoaL-like aldol condensation-catalyzing enzyme